jgi:hydrogenase nickel incorporation protein HypA/HybF
MVLQQVVHDGSARILEIRMDIGEISAVVPEALHFCFGAVSDGTKASGAKLVISSIPWRMRCSACEVEYRVVDRDPTCPSCSHLGGTTLSGKELSVREIDIE